MVKKKENFIIPKKSMLWIGGSIAVAVVLLAKNKAPEFLLFVIGIIVGFFIAKGYFKK